MQISDALLDAGLVPSRDVKIQWLGSHAKVAEAVKAMFSPSSARRMAVQLILWASVEGLPVSHEIFSL